LAPLYERLGVDLHLSGHDQNYERTHPLQGGRCSSPLAAGRALTEYQAGEGVLYAKVSPGGKLSARTGSFSGFDAPAPSEVAARSDSHHHWALLTVSPRELRLRVEGLSPEGAKRSTIDDVRLIGPAAATVESAVSVGRKD
jgi:hypothetical protein